jgi:hypothetical protein
MVFLRPTHVFWANFRENPTPNLQIPIVVLLDLHLLKTILNLSSSEFSDGLCTHYLAAKWLTDHLSFLSDHL